MDVMRELEEERYCGRGRKDLIYREYGLRKNCCYEMSEGGDILWERQRDQI